MSTQDPRFPGEGVTLRILRDDNKTYAGVTIPTEIFNITLGRQKLSAATGLSAGEVTRANLINFSGMQIQREPNWYGPGWCIFNSAANRVAYILRDDNTHLSFGEVQTLFTVARTQAALNATSGLSAAESARIAAMYIS